MELGSNTDSYSVIFISESILINIRYSWQTKTDCRVNFLFRQKFDLNTSILSQKLLKLVLIK